MNFQPVSRGTSRSRSSPKQFFPQGSTRAGRVTSAPGAPVDSPSLFKLQHRTAPPVAPPHGPLQGRRCVPYHTAEVTLCVTTRLATRLLQRVTSGHPLPQCFSPICNSERGSPPSIKNDRTSPLDSANRCYGISRPMAEALLAAFTSTECFQQVVQKHCLALQDLKSRLGNAKPRRAIDLRK